MKRIILVITLLALLAALPLAAACNTTAPATTKPAASPTPTPTPTPAAPIELSYSIFFPPTHLNAILGSLWGKELETRSNGRVKVTAYPGGTLTPAAKVYDGVVQGITDMGMSVLAYTVGRFPASELVDLPHGYPNGWVATMVANDFYQHFKPAEFDDVHVLYFHAHGPSVVLTTKKPVRKMEDLKGLIIRSTGVGAKIMTALGAQGNGAAQGEAYELMSKGIIDGSYTPREVLKGWNQAEVVKYVTGCYDVGSTANMFVVMNKAKWALLPAEIQRLVDALNTEWIDKHGKVWTYYDQVAMDYLKTFADREVITLPADEMARWVKVAVDPLISTYITEKTALKLPAQEYQDYLLKQVSYFARQAPTSESMMQQVKKDLEPLIPASK
ncbi:MAG: TRAP transporter substrate-binding protein [Dehalococcoidales bacterium]|nr:TRAP transporter substrate-binding protein [Dehalococcoidales bacterium]